MKGKPYDLDARKRPVGACVSPAVYQQIRQLAADRGLAVSAVARELLEKALEPPPK